MAAGVRWPLIWLAALCALELMDRYFTCTAENTELQDYKFGSKFKLEIGKSKRRSLTNMPATEQYVNQSSPVALQGTQHKLHCFFSGFPAPKPDWYHNGIKLDEDRAEGFRFESYGKTLVFNVTLDKAGKYDCRFPGYNDIDRTFNVMVEAAPYWSSPEGPPPNTNTSEGETVVFECKTSGKPLPKVTFYKNGVEMKNERSSSSERYLVEGNKLTIYNVQKGIGGTGDNAVYQCKAENKHGYLWTNFFLNLLAFKPHLINDTGEVEAVEGAQVTLFCKFFASPLAEVTWSSVHLAGVDHEMIPTDADGMGKLIIKKVTPNMEGEYKCTGKNKYGTTEGAAKLLVRKATLLEPFAKTEEIYNAGSPIRLPCAAKADDRLEVTYEWLINGETIPQSRIDDGHYKIESDNTLLIESGTQYDTAKFKCVASTKLDKIEKEVKLVIKDVPAPPHAAYVAKCEREGRSAEIKFEHTELADMIAPVTEFWVQYQMDSQTDGDQWRTHPVAIEADKIERIDDGNRMSKGSITIDLQPYGKYQFRVLARNSVGDSSATKVKDRCETMAMKPDKNPEEVKASGTSPENMIVYWKPMPREDWYGPDFHYKIKYRPKEGNAPYEEVEVRDPFADKYTITFDESDKEPFQEYEVIVQAVNAEGPSTVTPETNYGRTGEGTPSSIPDGFRVISKSSTSATFAWNAVDPKTANGNFTGYKITYWYEDDDETEESEDEDETTEEPTSSRFRWRRAVEYDSDKPHRRMRREPRVSKKKTIVFGPGATQGTINDLKPAKNNFATIRVMNGAHEGRESEAINFHTDEGMPSPVRGFAAYPMDALTAEERGVVHLVWKKPRHPNGKILDYTVEVCRLDANNRPVGVCPEKKFTPDVHETRLSDLEHESNYRFVIRANTRTGKGDPNSADAKTTPQVAAANVDPPAPSLVEGGIGEDHVNITYRPPPFDEEVRGPVGNKFAVQYREQGTEEWKEVPPKDDGLTVNVDGLDPGTTYDVRVAAIHQPQEGGEELRSYSDVSTVTTRGQSPRTARLWLLLLILLILLLLLLICCIICVAMRHRGQNYPVSEKEREQGREPILQKERFGEFKGEDDEKRSLTGSKAESETDSMAEYGDGDHGRFTEDGSFIGQYVPQKTLMPAERPEKGSTSTFV